MNTQDTPTLPDQDAVAYTDGCSIPNPGRGGHAWTLSLPDGQTVEFQRHVHDATNVTQEMEAVETCLAWLHPMQTAVIYTDSQIVANGCNEWRHGWKAKGWRKGKNKPVANVEIWQRIDALLENHPNVRIEWLKGHNGDVGNERADTLAKQAAVNWGLTDGILTVDQVAQ